MNDDKQLITSIKTTLYQREKLVDKIQFLFPEYYEDISLKEFTAALKYLDQGNEPHSEILVQDSELYKGHIRYVLPVDTNLNRFSGDVTVRITLTKTDIETKCTQVFHTGEITIPISPLQDWYKFASDSSLEVLDQKMLELEAKIEATEKIAGIYDKTKADDITYENGKIQLSANGEKIGNAIDSSCKCGEDGIPVVDFGSDTEPDIPTDDTGDNDTDNERDVVEF